MKFVDELTQLETFKALARALPRWSQLEGGLPGSGFVIEVAPASDGLAIGLKLPKSMPQEEQERVARSLLSHLGEEERLMRLTVLVDEMRNVGVAAEVIEPMAAEAERLALKLHPKDH